MLEDYRDLIDELLGTPKVLRQLLDGHPSPQMLALIAALRDRDEVVLERLQRFTRQNEPHLKSLPPEAAVAEGIGGQTDAAALIDSFDTARGELVSLLMNLALKDWERTATHDDGGVLTLAEEVERHVEFEEALMPRIESAAS